MKILAKTILWILPIVILSAIITAHPPNKSYDIDDLMISLLDEVIVGKYEHSHRPTFSWHDGERRYWQDSLPKINVYGCTKPSEQMMILTGIKSRLHKFNLPGANVTFYLAEATHKAPAELLDYYTVTID